MLTALEIESIDSELAHCHDRRAAGVLALAAVQKSRGWVPDEALADLAAYLSLTVDELDSVATFFNLIYRKAAGRHVILVCDGIVCWMLGGQDLKEHLLNRLGISYGETTKDNRFTLLPNACLGICDKAPAMMIDDDTYTGLTPGRIDEILDRYE
jgi:NADH-quinone oxidoreductase subunit E